MLEIRSVSVSFDKTEAVKNVSFCVGESSIYGLAGYNGAGKTTLIKAIAGIYKPDMGEVLIDGMNTYDGDTSRESMMWVPDSPCFLPNATLDGMARFYSSIYDGFSQSTYERLVKCFELDRKSKLTGFSKGMQRQASLLLAFSAKPHTLIIDECFDGLDPTKRILAKDLLLEYMAELKSSVLVASHDLAALSTLADHIGFLKNGELVLDSDCDALLDEYRKVRIAFADAPHEDALKGLHYRGFKPDAGRNTAVTAVYGKPGDISQQLSQNGIEIIQDIPMTLDEIFLCEMQGAHQNVCKIFE